MSTNQQHTSEVLAQQIDAVVASIDLGSASARKGGRNPAFPYVPLIKLPEGGPALAFTQQIKGLAYATREEAVHAAQRHIDGLRRRLAHRLAEPANRALREHYGLPRELS